MKGQGKNRIRRSRWENRKEARHEKGAELEGQPA